MERSGGRAGRILFHAARLVFLLGLVVYPSSFPQNAAGAPLRELARKILAAAGPLEEFSLSFRDLSSATTSEVTESKRALEEELRASGVRITEKPDGAAKLVVTLSENLTDRLWVAEIQRGSARGVVMVTRQRAPSVSRQEADSQLTIQKKLIIEQERPILDVLLLDKEMVVLDPEQVSLYRRKEESWELRQAFSIPGQRLLDSRGRLYAESGSAVAYLPEVRCTLGLGPGAVLDCGDSPLSLPLEIGPVEFAKGRNYFAHRALPPFYTMASSGEGGGVLWVLAGIDGRTHLFDKSLSPIGSFTGWGSDVAGIETGCGSGRQVLVTTRSDTAEQDAVQAFEIRGRHAVAVSPALDFPGPITALWTGDQKNLALAVCRNLRTGLYAALHLSVVCGR